MNIDSQLRLFWSLGILLTGFGTASLCYFLTAEWFTEVRFQGAAYGKDHFAALCFYTFFTPVGASLLFTAAQFGMRLNATGKSLKRYLVSASIAGAVVITALVYGLVYFGDIFAECGFVFCLHRPGRYLIFREDVEPAAANGFKITVGIGFFLCAIVLIVTLLARVIDQLLYADYHHAVPVHSLNDSNPEITTSVNLSPENASEVLIRGSKSNTDQEGEARETSGYGDDEDEDDQVCAVPSTRHKAFNTAMYPTVTKQSPSYQQIQDNGKAQVARAFRVRLTWRAYFWFFFYIGAMFLYYLTTTYIPNNWEYFASYRIARFGAYQVSEGPEKCADWKHWRCPELPDAVFRTTTWEAGEYIRFKIFPSNAWFFTFIFGVPIFAFLIRSIPSLDKFLSRKISVEYNVCSFLACFLTCGCVRRVSAGARCWDAMRSRVRTCCKKPDEPPKTKSPAYFSLKEVLLIAFGSVCLFCFTWYWGVDHNYIETWPSGDMHISEVIARTSGMVAVFFLSLLMFPAARNSPLYSFLGISWEDSMRYHRALGYGFLLTTAVHVITNYWWFIVDGVFPHDVIIVPAKHPKTKDNFTVPLASVVTYFTFIGVGIFAGVERYRREKFELFMIFHYISYFTLLPTVLWHAQAAWEYLMPGFGIFILDRAIRAYRSSRAVHLLDARTTVEDEKSKSLPSNHRVATGAAADYGAAGRIVHLRVAGGNMKYLPGQYAFINIAELSLLEWHPFTISSPVHHTHAPDEITFHIKDMGPNTWTSRLYNLVAEGNPITVSLDGPYGHPIDFRKYSTVLLVAGGIGITPVKSIFESMRLSYLHDKPADYTIHNTGLEQTKEADTFIGKIWKTLTSVSDTLTDPEGLYEIVADSDENSESSGADENAALAEFPRRVHMLVAARDSSLMSIMKDSISNLPDGPFSARVYVNSPPGEVTTGAYQVRKLSSSFSNTPPYEYPQESEESLVSSFVSSLVERSRPNVAEILPKIVDREDNFVEPAYARAHFEFVSNHNNENSASPSATSSSSLLQDRSVFPRPPNETLLFVCGPAGLSEDCEKLAYEQGWVFHSETFEL